jgi:hypothetical protein
MVGGFPSSITVMVKLQLPPPSVDVEVTTVVPTGKNEPDAGDVVTVPQSPDSTGAAKLTWVPRTEFSSVSALALMLFGQFRIHVGGGVPLPTVTAAVV